MTEETALLLVQAVKTIGNAIFYLTLVHLMHLLFGK